MPREAELCQLLTRVVTGIGDSLASVTRRDCTTEVGDATTSLDVEGWLWLLDAEKVALRGCLESVPSGDLLLVLDVRDVIALAGAIDAVPDTVIQQHRDSGLLESHLDNIPELGNLAFAATRRELDRACGAAVPLRFVEHGVIRPGFDPDGFLGDGERTILEFVLTVGDFPRSRGYLIASPGLLRDVMPEADLERPEPGGGGFLDLSDGLERPVRARIAGYLTTPESAAVVQECADQLGLSLDRRPKQEIPNPAAHRGEIVVIEVRVGDEKRFEWARRLREQQPDASVVLLVHEPSRARVIQGVLTKANAVVACPVGERELWARLAACVPVDPCPVRKAP